jgi:hypothetical protein
MSQMKLVFFAIPIIAGLVCSSANADIVNGFANGGFELSGASTPAAAWINAAEGYTRSTDARTGEFSAQLMSPSTNAAVMLQNSTVDGMLPALIEGDQPLLSFWAKGFAGTTGNVLFALRYLDSNGIILSSSGEQFFQTSINTSTWTEITYDLGVVPVGAETAFIEFSQAIGPIDDNNLAGTVLIDDVFLGVTAVPEPSVFASLVALGILASARRRRAK